MTVVLVPVCLFAAIGISMIAFPRWWNRWARAKFENSRKPIKIEAIQLKSDGAWRVYGIGLLGIAAFLVYYVWRYP